MMRYTLAITTVVAVLLVACSPDEDAASQVTDEAPEENEQQAVQVVDEGPDEHLIHRPNEVEWEPGPGSFEEGSEWAVLEGDPGEEGVFTMQIKMPDGFVINPHWHPNVERVTVLEGTFNLGSGEELDPEATEALEAGSYTSMPPEMRHYAVADGETIIQLTTVGPWEINYVNEEDDPRPRADVE